MIVNLDQVPPPSEKKPGGANVFTVSMMMHGLITSQELEILYDMMSADYLLDVAVKANFDTCGTIKTEMVTRVIKWNMAKESKGSKLHKVDAPSVKEFKAVSFVIADEYDWDNRNRLKKGNAPYIRATMEDEGLMNTAGSAWNSELEDTNMFQTDSRDRPADRDAETYDNQRHLVTVCSRRTLDS